MLVLKSLFYSLTLCCRYSKESSQWDDSFEYLQHRVLLDNKRDIVRKRVVNPSLSGPLLRIHDQGLMNKINKWYHSMKRHFLLSQIGMIKVIHLNIKVSLTHLSFWINFILFRPFISPERCKKWSHLCWTFSLSLYKKQHTENIWSRTKHIYLWWRNKGYGIWNILLIWIPVSAYLEWASGSVEFELLSRLLSPTESIGLTPFDLFTKGDPCPLFCDEVPEWIRGGGPPGPTEGELRLIWFKAAGLIFLAKWWARWSGALSVGILLFS